MGMQVGVYGPAMTPTATSVVVGTAFGFAGVLIGPIRISPGTRRRALCGLAIAVLPIVVWLLCGGPIVPTMLAFCAATLALGEWRARLAGARKARPARRTAKTRAPARKRIPRWSPRQTAEPEA